MVVKDITTIVAGNDFAIQEKSLYSENGSRDKKGKRIPQ